MNLQLTMALRYLNGRKLRSFLTTLAIMFGVLLIFGMNSMMPAMMQAFQVNIMAMAGEVDASITHLTGEAFSEDVISRVAEIDGVRATAGTLERSINLPPDYIDSNPAAQDRVSSVTLVGLNPDAARTLRSYTVLEGRFLDTGDESAAVITESLAEAAGLGLGQTLSLPTPQGTANLAIVGILPQRLMPGNEEVLVTLTQAQYLLNSPGKINVIEANFDSAAEARRAETEQAIHASLGEGFSTAVIQPGAEILTNIQVGQMIMTLLGGMGLLMGAFIIFNTFRTIVAERRRDIGMLRSIGASRSTIIWLILTEGLIQGVIGTILGLVFGYLFAVGLMVAIAPIMQQFINLEFTGVPIVPWLVAVSIAAGVGVTLLAGLLPAISASRISPLEALRPSLGKASLKRVTGLTFWIGVAMIAAAVAMLFSGSAALLGLGSVLLIGGLLLVGPALIYPIANLFGRLLTLVFARNGTAELAEGNLSRQPGRAAVTASTTMIALAILLMAASIVTSIRLTFTRMIEESLSSDYLLLPPSVSVWGLNVGASPALADDLRTIEGVDVVSSLRFANTQINGVAVGLLGIHPENYLKTSGLTFTEGDSEAAFQAVESGRGVIINGILSTMAGIELGDQVEMLTSTGTATYTVVGIASDFMNAKTNTGYISQQNIAADFGRTEDVFYQIELAGGANKTAVESAIKERILPFPQFKLVDGQQYMEQNLQLFNSAFIGLYAMVIFLGIPSLIAMVNTLAIGVIERRREIGMLRAVGATRKQVRTIILAEAFILAAIGTAFGLLAGLYLGYMVVGAMNDFGLPVDYIFPASGMVLAIAAGLLFGALAAIIPARQAAGMEIVAALRYE